MGELELLVKFSSSEDPARLVRVTVSRGETVGALKEKVLIQEGIKPVPGCHISLTFNGVELLDGQSAEQCGLVTSTGAERWAGDYIYPNGWYLMAHRKPTPKASDPLWAPKRPYVTTNNFALLPLPHWLKQVMTPTTLLTVCVMMASLLVSTS